LLTNYVVKNKSWPAFSNILAENNRIFKIILQKISLLIVNEQFLLFFYFQQIQIIDENPDH